MPVLFLDRVYAVHRYRDHRSGSMERMDIMRKVALVDYGKLELQENCGDIKTLEPGTVKIDVTACSICGSDIALYRGKRSLRMKDISGMSFPAW